MAHQTKIKNWIAASADALDLGIVELGWPAVWAPGFTATQATVSIGGRKFTGTGIARDTDLAVVKATVEAIERWITTVNELPNSSGLAGHDSIAQASINARNELVERDAFFCHYLTNTPFLQMLPSDLAKNALIDWQRLSSQATDEGVELRLARMVVPTGIHGIVCFAFGARAKNPFGVIAGLGCAENFDDAVLKAILECLGNTTAQIDGVQHGPISRRNFGEIPNPGVMEHMRLGLSSESTEVIRNLLRPSETAAKPLNMSQIELVPLMPPENFQGCPLVFVHARAGAAQSAFFGHLQPNFLNIDRLGMFAGKQLKMNDIQSHPHILG